MDISPIVFYGSIFVLAIFVGYYVVWSVTPALHTPLMSVTNAISAVIIVGAIIAIGTESSGSLSMVSKIVSFFALIFASINIFGGFLVTQRMLAMYKKKVKKMTNDLTTILYLLSGVLFILAIRGFLHQIPQGQEIILVYQVWQLRLLLQL